MFLLLKYRVFFTAVPIAVPITKLHDVFIVHSTADLFKRVRVGGNLFVFRIFQPVRVGNPVREGRARFGKSQKLSGAVNYYPEISVREFETNKEGQSLVLECVSLEIVYIYRIKFCKED